MRNEDDEQIIYLNEWSKKNAAKIEKRKNIWKKMVSAACKISSHVFCVLAIYTFIVSAIWSVAVGFVMPNLGIWILITSILIYLVVCSILKIAAK